MSRVVYRFLRRSSAEVILNGLRAENQHTLESRARRRAPLGTVPYDWIVERWYGFAILSEDPVLVRAEDLLPGDFVTAGLGEDVPPLLVDTARLTTRFLRADDTVAIYGSPLQEMAFHVPATQEVSVLRGWSG